MLLKNWRNQSPSDSEPVRTKEKNKYGALYELADEARENANCAKPK